MVEFDGVIDYKIKSRTLRTRMRMLSWGLLVAASLGVVLTIVNLPINSESETEILVFTILMTIIAVIILIIPFKTNIEWNVNVKISTDNIEYSPPVCIEPTIIPLEKVKKVIDEGDCYQIIYVEYSNAIICQKDLLVQGTLEEFEEIFKDKLVSKIKVKSDKTK